MQIGYCGNVHPGRTIEEVKQNLTLHSLEVKRQFSPDQPMGIGLWLSETASQELDDQDELCRFRDWLTGNGLVPFTLNGFPFGDFHQEVVKLDVYRPTWAEVSRLDYTVRLAEILNVLLPEGINGTISTLPLGWPVDNGKSNVDSEHFWKACVQNLKSCAERLDHIAQTSGRNICVCIEPEPLCILDTCDDIVGFFEQSLLGSDERENERIRNHIGVCHDICHSAVMFEKQETAVEAYREAKIQIGKVQVSSAVAVDFDSGSEVERRQKLEQLVTFSEPKYMHQTSILNGDSVDHFDDLDLALKSVEGTPTGQWRVHFHVPIFSNELDLIGTTQKDIGELVSSIQDSDAQTPHFEVETYAWNVLPERLREGSLADGIAHELRWFSDLINSPG